MLTLKQISSVRLVNGAIKIVQQHGAIFSIHNPFNLAVIRPGAKSDSQHTVVHAARDYRNGVLLD